MHGRSRIQLQREQQQHLEMQLSEPAWDKVLDTKVFAERLKSKLPVRYTRLELNVS